MFATLLTPLRDQHELLHLGEIFNALAKIVALDKRASFDICELGCATGWLAQELTAIGRVTGVDPDAQRIADARVRYPNVVFEVAELAAWAPPRAFDLVVSSEVIEHLADKAPYVAALKRLVKPSGWILVTTPNQKMKAPWDAAGMGEGLYEDWLTVGELRALFADCEIIQHSTFLCDFAYSGIYRYLNAHKLRALLARLKLDAVYGALRLAVGHGLYQLLLCRKA